MLKNKKATMFKNIFNIFLISISLFSCIQKPNFPFEPSISYNKISNTNVLDVFSSSGNRKVFKDSVSISINFKDGDGDLGVSETQKDELTKKNEFNYIVKRFLRVKGKYVEYDPLVPLSGNFITLKSGSKAGPIEGILNYNIDFNPVIGLKKDTIKFQIQILDRAKNSSNTVMTDSVLVYEIDKSRLKP